MSLRGRPIALVAAAVLLGLAVAIAVRQSPSERVEPGTTANGPVISSLPLHQAANAGTYGETLRAALQDPCAEAGDDVADPDGRSPRLESFDAWQRQLLDRLSVSPTGEHLVLAAALDEDSASRIGLIGRAVSANPHDAFTLWNAVLMCTEEHGATGCPLRDWEQRLLRVDGENSESWIRVAANRYEARSLDGALDALNRAAASAETRAYWAETIAMVERGLAVAADLSFGQRVTMAFGIAAANLPRVGDYVNMCRAQSAIDVGWAYACLAYGRTLEKQGKTYNALSIGMAIQKLSLEALGDMDGAAAVQQRDAARSRELSGLASDELSAAERLVTSSPDRFSSYLETVKGAGEWSAMAALVDEAGRLPRPAPTSPCVPDH